MYETLGIAKEVFEEAQVQLFDAYLGIIRESYLSLSDQQRTSLIGALENIVSRLSEGRMPLVFFAEKLSPFDSKVAKEIRSRTGLNLRQLEGKIGASKSALSALERGEFPKQVGRSESCLKYLRWLAEIGNYNPFGLDFTNSPAIKLHPT